MLNRAPSIAPELSLLLACSRVALREEEERAIRQALEAGIDWTAFARMAIDHGLASLAGVNLARAASDLMPDDILDALAVNLKNTRARNQALLDEFMQILDTLSARGIEAIPLKGPTLAIQAYGDIGLRVFRDIDFLTRDGDLGAVVAALMERGYKRNINLTETQAAVIQRLHGQDFLVNKKLGLVLEPHTRLIPMKLALDIDYTGLWSRARPVELDGRTVLTFAPEDTLLVLAIHGGKEMWWNIKWTADIAAFIRSSPQLDWPNVTQRARAQGCLRMLLLATALARTNFASAIPDEIFQAQRADPGIEDMVRRIVARWQDDRAAGPPSNKTVSWDRLRLHDGILRRARYVARTLLLPGAEHVQSVSLPRGLSAGYIPLKLAHDALALPLWRAWQLVVAQGERCRNALIDSGLPISLMPMPMESRTATRHYRESRSRVMEALANSGDAVAPWANLGDALSRLGRHAEAVSCYDRSIALLPAHSAAWKSRGTALRALGKQYEFPTPALDPRDATGWAIRAGGLFEMQRFAEAVEASEQALGLDPGKTAARRIGIHARLRAADWRSYENDKRIIAEQLDQRHSLIAPMYLQCISDSEAEHLTLARIWADKIPKPQKLFCPTGSGNHRGYGHRKIRIAYISSDFGNHVVSHAFVGCLEHHDKSRFEITAISLTPNDGGNLRRRVEASVDHFVEVLNMTDRAVAGLIRDREIDIAVDLNGFTAEARSGILAHRPAPVQVNYLGYPGTMGAQFIDYIIADPTVVPEENAKFYDEKIARLPSTFMPMDNSLRIDERTPTRTEAGLPDTGFVFACLNAERKVGPQVFDIWMRLLRGADGSVLWLRSTNTSATANLRREARARGVDPDRLIFAPQMPDIRDYLARFGLADLFLDTIPYNAHVTACNALWAGLPVLTCPGNTFSGRVAASLLYAIGLPELVTSSLGEYEVLALALARNPERLGAIRQTLARNRDTYPLFDTERFTRNLESLFTAMWQRNECGESPRNLTVGED